MFSLTDVMRVFDNRAREFEGLREDQIFMFDASAEEIIKRSQKRTLWGLGKPEPLDFKVRTTSGFTPFSKTDDLAKIKLFIENGADINNVDVYGENALFSQSTNIESSTYLLEKGINVNQKNKKGQTVFDELSFSLDNQKEMGELYIKYGADIHHVNPKTQRNALFTLDAEKGLFLVEHGINIHQVDKYGRNMLFYLRSNERDGSLQLLTTLIEGGVNINQIDEWGRNALFGAGADIDKARILVNAGIDVHQVDKTGKNALEYTYWDRNESLLLSQRIKDREYTEPFNYNKMKHFVRSARERNYETLFHEEPKLDFVY